MEFDPTEVRLSTHFLLSDFLGNHSVYSRGLANRLEPDDPELPLKMRNARALCEHILEPLLEQAGPFSISYGYIAPTVSDKIVTYQNPRKPSHHMWNLGAAVDICVHEWTNHDPEDDTEKTAPIALAHEIHAGDYPYSRLITYSESPYLCIAASAEEIAKGEVRKAFYENRYAGVAGVKPLYKSYATSQAKEKARQTLDDSGLTNGWRGIGYPSYHGGGRKQYHHHRISKYTMLSDWLFSLKSITNGTRNIPALNCEKTMSAFRAAGAAYDYMVEMSSISRFSIVMAYEARPLPGRGQDFNNWSTGDAFFHVEVPGDMNAEALVGIFQYADKPEFFDFSFAAIDERRIAVIAKEIQ